MTLHAQADVLTMALFRGLIGVPLLFAWLMIGANAKTADHAGAEHLSLFIGLLFAGNVFFLFKAIEAMEVPLAILTYFTYPLLTGLAAAAFGIERLGLAGLAAALAAFAGPRADDRRASRRRRAHGHRLRADVVIDARGDPAADPRASCRAPTPG